MITLPANTNLYHLRDVYELAEKLLADNGLTDWSIEFDGSKLRAGVTYTSQHKIGLSARLTALWDIDQCRTLILHEIAHALCPPSAGHNAIWRRKCRELGIKPERCYSQSEVPGVMPRWVGTCPNGHTLMHHRKTAKMYRVSCGKCSPKFNAAYKFTWRENSEA
jgi:predicted SprT family Zn-dependent metalloprotease